MLKLLGSPPDEVPLPEAPLALVLCQISFPEDRQFESEEAARRIHGRLKGSFPVIRSEDRTEATVTADPGGLEVGQTQVRAWLFEVADRSWKVTLTRSFVALSTTAYDSRDDFLDRLRPVVAALEEETDIVVRDRVGIRYVDLAHHEEVLEDLSRFINPHLLGAAAIQDPAEGVTLRHSVTDAVIDLSPSARMRTRAGVLPPMARVDPGVEPVNTTSWFLDIDAFEMRADDFGPGILEIAEELATAAYSMFRWSTTDDFIQHYGGTA